MACTVDCLSQYSCNKGIITPQEGAVYAPFVQLTFGTDLGQQVLTVGNKSSPNLNFSAIKSFEYGECVGGTGLGFKVEVLDEGGVMYRGILHAINKTVALALDDTKNCTCKFGWIITDCNGDTTVVSNEDYGGKLYFLPMTMSTMFENGLLKFTFEGTSMVSRWAITHLTKTFGSQEQKMPLKQALQELFESTDPKVEEVKFVLADGTDVTDGKAKDANGKTRSFFKMSDGGDNGPLGSWKTNQQNALDTARNWLSSVTTANDLGILILYDAKGPSIIFQEDPTKFNCSVNPQCGQNIGTFIVNGGNCTPVLSFNPKIDWNKLSLPDGGDSAAGPAAVNSTKEEPEPCIEKGPGTQTGITIQESDWLWRIPEEMAPKNAEAFGKHLEANSKFSVKGTIEAELKLFGRPDLYDTIRLIYQTVSIIVINPFFISQKNDCTWITTSNCNRILSNKYWRIKSVSHQINNGSYITTLNLYLAAPNDTLPASAGLGGAGETFANSAPLTAAGTS